MRTAMCVNRWSMCASNIVDNYNLIRDFEAKDNPPWSDTAAEGSSVFSLERDYIA